MGLLQPHGRGRRPIRRLALRGSSADPVFVVHSLTHAAAALAAAAEADRGIVLLSAPAAALYAGPGWWRELVKSARAEVPDARCAAILDCGDDAGAAQGAIRARVEALVFTGRPEVAERLADIAAQGGIELVTERPAATLDLGEMFFADPATLRRRCAEALAQSSAASRERM
jgi:hypothetical protein